MRANTVYGASFDARLLGHYCQQMVNMLFKILPMRENDEPTLHTYMESLELELVGCSELIEAMHDDASFLSVLSILQYLIDHEEESQKVYKREIFKAISLCNKMRERWAGEKEM
jgi:hypothetical protein